MTRAKQHPILLLSMAAFFSVALMRACDPLVPEIARSFNVTVAMAAMPVTAYVVAYGVGQLAYGPIGSRIGAYKVATYGCIVAAVLSFICAFAFSLNQLILARAFAGLAAGAIIPMSMAFIGETVPYENRQKTLARFLTGAIFGSIAGVALSGFFAQFVDWRYVFAALAIGLALVSTGLWRQRPQGNAQSERRPTTALPLRQYGNIIRQHWPRVILILVFFEGFFVLGVIPFIAVMLAEDYGLSNLAIGVVLSFFGFGALTYAFSAGHILKLLDEQGCARIGGCIVLLGYGAMALSSTIILTIFGSFAAGLGYMMLHNTLQTNATQMVPDDRSGAMSLFAFCLFVGQAVGVSAFALLSSHIDNQAVIALSGLVVAVLGMSFARMKVRRQ